MKLTQKYPLSWNLTCVYEVMDSKVIESYTSLSASGYNEYLLTEISPRTSRVKQGNKSLQNIAWILFFCAALVSILKPPFFIFMSLTAAFLFGAGMCVLWYFLKKSEYEIFKNKNNETLFWIKYTKTGEEKPFIEEIKRRVSHT